MNINLGIYLKEKNNYTTIYKIVDFFYKNYSVVNFYIFTDNQEVLDNPNIAYLPTFYMSFSTDTLVFTDIDSYMLYKDNIISDKVYVLNSSNNSLNLPNITEIILDKREES